MPKSLSPKYRQSLDRLANQSGLKLDTRKSSMTRKPRSTKEIELENLLSKIESHDWGNGISGFARSLDRSVTWLTPRIAILVKRKKIVRFDEGIETGGRRSGYQVMESGS
jgi:hypothetical protein